MKKLVTILLLCSLSLGTYAQLHKVYKNRKWDMFMEATRYSSNDPGLQTGSFYFVKPFYMRIVSDNDEQWKSHFSWYISLGNDAVWGAAALLLDTQKVNNLGLFNNQGMASGILGIFDWKLNIIGQDKLNAALGLQFGDYTMFGGYMFGIGPSALVEISITDGMAIGINASAVKLVGLGTTTATSNWMYSFSPRLLFQSGFYIEGGTSFSSSAGLTASRLDLRIGKTFK